MRNRKLASWVLLSALQEAEWLCCSNKERRYAVGLVLNTPILLVVLVWHCFHIITTWQAHHSTVQAAIVKKPGVKYKINPLKCSKTQDFLCPCFPAGSCTPTLAHLTLSSPSFGANHTLRRNSQIALISSFATYNADTRKTWPIPARPSRTRQFRMASHLPSLICPLVKRHAYLHILISIVVPRQT
jgi:hypothetical protein